MGNRFWAHLAILGANIIYGLNYSIAKGLMPNYIEPFGFIFCRVSGALVLFWLLGLVIKSENIATKDIFRLALCGLFGVATNQLSFFYGLNLTTPINAAIIMTCNPIMVLVFAAFIIKEKITSRKIIGIVMGIAGALGLILYKSNVDLSGDSWKGDLFILINATSYAIYLVLVKPLMQKYEAITVIKYIFLFGFLIVIPFGYTEFTQVNWSNFTAAIWASFAFVIIGTTFLAYLFNIYGLKTLNPSTVSTYIYSQPLIASIFAILMDKDDLNWAKVVAAGLIFTGVYLVSSKSKKLTKQHT